MTRRRIWRALAHLGVAALWSVACDGAAAQAQVVQETAVTPTSPDAGAQASTSPDEGPGAGSATPMPSAAAPPLPALPNTGFGYNSFPSTLPGAAPAQANPQLPPRSSLALTPVAPGATPVQQGNNRAPTVLIAPRITVLEGLDDNPRGTRSKFVDSLSELNPGLSISADTPRLQGQLNYSLDYRKYARATDQDALDQNLTTYNLATIVPGLLYVDGRAAISQLSTTGGFAFTNPSNIPAGQSTQVTTASISPILQKSFGETIDTQVRYVYGLTDFGNPGLGGGIPSPTSLSNITQNEINAVAATHGYGKIASRLTIDGTQVDSQSLARSTQLRAYDDIEYRLNPQFSLVGRVGYENLRFPLDPVATTTGPTWLIGGQVNGGSGSYARLEYGKTDGIYGFSGDLKAQVTAATSLLASYQQSLSSPQQQILSNLNGSQLSSSGAIVNRQSGLPTGLANSEFAFSTNSIFKYRQLRLGAQTAIGRNRFGAFGFFDTQTSLTVATPSSQGWGVNLSWGRSITPRLTGNASVGYAEQSGFGGTSWTANLDLTYAINDKLNGILRYSFYDLTASAATGSTSRDLIEIGLSRTF